MKLAISLVLLGVLFSCGKTKDDETTVAATDPNQLSASDLAAPTGITVLTKADVTQNINYLSLDATFKDSPKDTTTSKCDSVFTAPKVVAAGNAIIVSATLDIKSCSNETAAAATPPSDLQLKSAIVKIYSRTECTGKDLSSYNGKTVGQIEDLNLQTFCTSGYSVVSNSRSDLEIVSQTDTTYSFKTTTIDAFGTADNGPCATTITSGTFKQTGCVEISKSISSGSNESVEYRKVTQKDLTWTASTADTWYKSGTMDVILNDWTGTVTFSGATTPPTYSFKKGSATVNGTVPARSTTLTNRILSKYLPNFKQMRR